MGPDFRLHDPADYPIWYGFEHPSPHSSTTPCTACRSCTGRSCRRSSSSPEAAIVGSPGCYPTTTILALAPLARAGLIGDLVVDAKSGVSGAGKEPKPDLHFGEVDESVSAYGLFTHRHTAELEQELGALSGGARGHEGGASTSCLTSSR